MSSVKQIVESCHEPVIVVVSALGGITDRLIETARVAVVGGDGYESHFRAIVERHKTMVQQAVEPAKQLELLALIDPLLGELGNIFRGVSLIKDLSTKTLDTIVSYGERLSSLIVSRVIEGAVHYDARFFIKTRRQYGKHIVDFDETNKLVKRYFAELPRVAVVPGFIASDRITGDVTKQLSEGSYSSAATSASDATIVYSSSNQEVATIAQDGLVTLVAGGTTTIKAEVAETATYEASFVEYTLTVIDPALIKTFAKVTSGAVTDGKYIIVYQDSDDATSVKAMNTTNTKDYFEYSEINLTDGKIVTDNQSIIWDITTQANGSMSISNGDNIFVGYRGSGNNAYIYEAYTEKNCDWTFTFADGLFTCTNGSVTDRQLQYNTNSPRFACYTGSQKNLTLYKLESGKQAVTVAFNEVNGDKEVFFTESFTYNSAATATPERPITYSSSNQEVATISTEGIVTVVGPGTTIIKATTEGNDTYEEGAAQYTLTVRAASVTLPYSTDFKSGLGDWIVYTPTGTTVWESSSNGATANGHKKGDGETFLVSPAVNAASIVLSFSSKVNYNGPAAQLFYSNDFDPSTMTQPSEATWTEITDMATWSSSQEVTPSGDIELKNLTAPIRFAFKYTCSNNDGAAEWTITDLSIKEGVASGIETVEANGMKIINGKGQVTIETAEAAHVAIYALTGAQVRQLNLVEGTNVVELPAGIYVIGRQKVVVF